MKFLGVPGVFDYAGLHRNSHYRFRPCCLPRIYTASASGLYVFAAQCPTPPILYLRFAAYLTIGLAQDSRPSGSLLLSCKALSSSTFMPVYLGAHKSPLHSSSSGTIKTLLNPYSLSENGHPLARTDIDFPDFDLRPLDF